ncbi:Inhibin beta chain [Trachymyrmex cornetzi]|uniref:Inhibin beta chain n=1 Tax=Trachymyrmex cornetzi TaxID=471704 RepID=A0A195DN26_9HYME|nr:Inhibin beta chain [Trachymyrmex cornetzi]
MPSPCLLCRHHHRRRRHRYTPSSPTPPSRCTVPSQVVPSSPVTAIVVVVVVVPVVPRHHRRQGASPLTASRGRSSPVRETSCSSASDASVVALSLTGNLTIPQEKESRSLFAHQVGHSGYRYRIKNRRKEGSTEARGGEGGGGGDERGDSPSRCTRCPTDTAVPQAKAETIGSSGSNSSSSISINSLSAPGDPHQQQQQQHHHHHHVHHEGPPRGGLFKDTVAPSPDDLRLEAIKHQILQKLGLRTRPDVNRTLATVPRHLALETLYRAEAQTPPRYSDRSRVDYESEYSGEFLYGGDEYSYRNLDQETTTTEGNARTTAKSYQGYDDVQEELDDFYARTSEIITFAEPGHTLNGQPLLEFPMSSGEPALEPLRIKRATLWARVELKHAHHYQHHRHSQINQRNITLWVFRVHCGNTTHLRGKELGQHLEMVTSLVVNVGQLGWQKFDVTKIVSRWYTTNYSKDKLTLLVDCSGCGSHVHISTFDGHSPHVIESSLNSKGDHDPDRPFLVVRTDPAAAKRVRRRAIECSGAIKGQCCKQRFYVSFSQLGWDDWIIAPQGYYANYCRGDCAAGHRTPDTFLNYYTHVIEEYRKMDRLAGMQPCCAPLKFSPMSLIYYGPDSNIIKRDLPKMVVDECGCP